MTRAAIFDAVRQAARPGLFNDEGYVTALDNLLDAFGVPRADAGQRSLSPAGEALIQKWEGYAKDIGADRVRSYPDPATGGAPWTIGWGSTGSDIGPDTIWTKAQAQARFREHVAEFGEGVRKAIGAAPTTQAQQDAMTSLAYNIGLTNFARSTLLKKHKDGDYAGAAQQFAVWNRANGKVMNGLTDRRADEARMYRGEA